MTITQVNRCALLACVMSTACAQGAAYFTMSSNCTGPNCPGACETSASCSAGLSCQAGTCVHVLGDATAGSTGAEGGSTYGFTTTGATTATTTGSATCTRPPPCACNPGCVADTFGVTSGGTGGTAGAATTTAGGAGTAGSGTAGTTGSSVRTGQGGQQDKLPAPDPSSNVYQDPNTGAITLVASSGTALAGEFAWVANSIEGTVSQVDTRLSVEVGRYPSVLLLNGSPAVPDWASQCNLPSRTAVDPSGNAAYVSNRANADDSWTYPSSCYTQLSNAGNDTGKRPALWDQGSVTKIARYDDALCDGLRNPGLIGCPCVDRNADKVITTSHDIDGDGIIWLGGAAHGGCAGNCSVTCTSDLSCQDPNVTHDAAARFCNGGKCSTKPLEFFGYNDECVLWTTKFPAPNGCVPGNYCGPKMRGMGVDPNGWLWVGDSRNHYIYKIDPSTGNLLDPTKPVLKDANTGVVVPSSLAAATVASPTVNTAVNLGSYVNSGVGISALPYGAIIDHTGVVSTVDRNGLVVQFNSNDGSKVNTGHALDANDTLGGYGVTIDGNNRIWVPAWGNNNRVLSTPKIRRYDPQTQQWVLFPPTEDHYNYAGNQVCLSDPQCADNPSNPNYTGTGGPWDGRGATTSDLGIVWAVYNAGYNTNGNPANWLVGFDINSGAVVHRVRTDRYQDGTGTWHDLACSSPIGVGIGANETVWIVAQASNTVCGYDPATGIWQVVQTGLGPYTYSDFTGNIYRTFTSGQGQYALTFNGCNTDTYQLQRWISVTLNATAPFDAANPNNASYIEVRVRVAASAAAFSSSAPPNWSQPVHFDGTSPDPMVLPLAVDPDAVLQLQFTLKSANATDSTVLVPAIQGISVARQCVAVGGG